VGRRNGEAMEPVASYLGKEREGDMWEGTKRNCDGRSNVKQMEKVIS
jgi:hypothetical protein